jgi:preprotein translocase subunit SecA
MIISNMSESLKRLHNRINGSRTEYNLEPYYEKISEIRKHEEQLKTKTDHQLKELSKELAFQARKGLPIDQFLFEAYAYVSETIKRVLKLNPFDTQLIGAIVMHQGKIVEMPTGEGKTLTAIFPAYLNALTGNGVHILTFNDYLARRDAQWMGPVYELLGLITGYVQEGMSLSDRRKAYSADITYLTAREAGFDFLRDGLSYNCDDLVQRNLHFAIIDEADSILIDEARIPLVIASASDDYIKNTFRMAEIARRLEKNADLEFDEYSRNFYFTDTGLKRIESILNCDNLYDPKNIHLLTQLNCAVHAEFLFQKDIDYIVRNNQIELVDEFTGRVADKRRWPDGLQAALEAKESINIQSKGKILNSITLQHFIGRYSKISGMTATAASDEQEFRQFYDLDIVVIPSNKPCIRKDLPDRLFKSKEVKKRAVIEEIVRAHKSHRPVLVGTASVEESEMLSNRLRKNNIECVVLNAKNDEYEAGIIANAGKLGAITISTNMAGRGTDIRLGGTNENERRQVAELGGLYVIGTNRHESRRIDNQLRGRAGRQGDPGSSCFFISMEDDIFTQYRLANLLPSKAFTDNHDDEIENSLIKKEAERIQRIVEGQNLEIKETLFKYSLLIERQRRMFFENRRKTLSDDSLTHFYQINCPVQCDQIKKRIGSSKLTKICRFISLHYIDKAWSQYLDEIAEIREGIHLTKLAYQDPLFEFFKIAVEMFDNLQSDIESKMINKFNDLNANGSNIDMDNLGLKAPSSTWTYLINDDPFENILATNFAGSMGLSIGWSFFWLWPLLLMFSLLKWLKGKTREKTLNT